MRLLMAVGLALSLLGQFAPRTVKGRYRLPAKGFSVAIPSTAIGLLGDDPVVERGIRMKLPSGSNIYVYGEPNSLEWPTPADGLRWIAEVYPKCRTSDVRPAMVGKILGAGTRLECSDRVIWYRLAFRPGGGPIYWLRLETDGSREAGDTAVLEKVAASFRIIRWE